MVDAELVALCEAKGWPGPTPIQAQCWPILCDDRDVVAVAETGSGKTLGFGMPALSKFKQALAGRGKRQPAMLVLAPTRELANQSFEVLQEFCGKVGATAAVAYGGVPKHEQKREIAKCAALVATPGRLNDFIQEGSVDLSKVSFFCLDEADRMLDMGFVQEVKKIAAACANPEKLTAMFSATWPTEVQNIASEFLKPDFVRVNRSRDGRLLEILKQRYQSGTSASYATARLIVFGLYKKECARLETFSSTRKSGTSFGSTVKKKQDKNYGAFGPKRGMEGKTATKITFD
ncbi:helicase [Aureococcus anophagefferens]|nr:helicase [Aureococcus anophagefferens]